MTSRHDDGLWGDSHYNFSIRCYSSRDHNVIADMEKYDKQKRLSVYRIGKSCSDESYWDTIDDYECYSHNDKGATR